MSSTFFSKCWSFSFNGFSTSPRFLRLAAVNSALFVLRIFPAIFSNSVMNFSWISWICDFWFSSFSWRWRRSVFDFSRSPVSWLVSLRKISSSFFCWLVSSSRARYRSFQVRLVFSFSRFSFSSCFSFSRKWAVVSLIFCWVLHWCWVIGQKLKSRCLCALNLQV